MRITQRERVPVVVQGRGRSRTGARALWLGAETAVTCGVLILLLVVHQLWWTNREARAEAREQVRVLEREWDVSPSPESFPEPFPEPSGDLSGGLSGEPVAEVGGGGGSPDGVESRPPRATAPSAPPPSAAFAVLRIPRLGLTVPVAEGVSKRSVLDKGYVGHYPGTGGVGRVGNFALAGHRNTHGEPFRYLNRLAPGDEISVRTRARTYVYRVDLVLASTSPRDVGVLRAVPRSLVKPSYGYDAPGAYLTLTTCTPEFTSTYRLVVWAKLVSTR
ncbi:class E sortase [Streptomyces sp. NRRL B-24572]|uniref:class E sortase n=1 Tax=Streptomyces sp. NRRL B-24572 TaxID=1962156 RepID=UPI000A3BE287|nr:class E sortase [Streptomyces sp. NRRL B-24572]